MADRRARAGAVEPERAEGATRAVMEGVAHHVRVDAWFHRAVVFVEGELAAREALRRAPTAAKLGLFAHVAWELCLDGALLRCFGLDATLAAIRASLHAVRPDAHHRAAALLAWTRTAEPSSRERFDARVDEILDAIARGPWVAGYATGSGIAERLDGVRARFGFPVLGEAERGAVAAGLDALADRADAALLSCSSAGSRPG